MKKYYSRLGDAATEMVDITVEPSGKTPDFWSLRNSENSENADFEFAPPIIKPRDVVYLAGPMTGKKFLNYPAFYGFAGIIAKEYQCQVLNPARQPNGLDYEEYMRRAFDDLDRATVIVMLDGWDRSSGARREFLRANQRRIGIILQKQLEHDLQRRFDAAQIKEANPHETL